MVLTWGKFEVLIVAWNNFELEFYKISDIWYETGKTRITFVLIVHRHNLCIMEHKLSILF